MACDNDLGPYENILLQVPALNSPDENALGVYLQQKYDSGAQHGLHPCIAPANSPPTSSGADLSRSLGNKYVCFALSSVALDTYVYLFFRRLLGTTRVLDFGGEKPK